MDNKRKYKLPSVNDLNKDQDKVLRLPESGRFLVIGGPGTGKSVISLMRMQKYRDHGNYIFLVYNRVLMESTKQVIEGSLNGETWISWFNNQFFQLTNKTTPLKSRNSYKNPDDKVIDFAETIIKITEFYEDLESDEKGLHIIIDEGQDMPPEFYEALLEMYYVNFFVVADQNQQITDQNSNIGEIKRWLSVDKVYSLKQNYRNSNPIAQLARHFYTDPATEKPELPEFTKTPFAKPQLCDYDDHEKIIKAILKTSDQDPTLLVGVFTCKNKTREKYLNALNNCNIKLDNNKPLISTYSSNGNAAVNIDFHRGGIVVLNDRSAKGLEFDIVFIADIDDFNVIRNIDEMKKRFYVMTSRAIKQLVLLRNSKNREEYRVDDILPNDENILKRMSRQ